MDTGKIGKFLSQLRRERNLTQEQLGDKLGVTNKTVSRWENGNYLPPVEMLQALSVFYGVSINEILSGERLSDTQYREKAEENIKTTLSASAFTLRERMAFYKRKWVRDNLFSGVLGYVLLGGLLVAGVIRGNELPFIAVILGNLFGAYRHNQLMTYVEQRAFDGSGRQ